MKNRIWELDAARGLALLGMLSIHFVYDLVELFGVFSWREPGWYLFIKNDCGFIFLVISGISATLGSRPLKRGIQVLLCGLLCSLVTGMMYLLGFADESIVIYFGVLHCLGVCQISWNWMKKLPNWLIALLGLLLTAIGLVLGQLYVDAHWSLIPLGLCPLWFQSSDYFPLLPNLGFFLLGTELGRMLYREKKTRLPRINADCSPIRQLRWLGNHSLPVYLLHQPVLAGISLVIKWIVSS